MQPSEIISVNIWQIVVSLCNLVILFLIVKKFLYKPVCNMLKTREELLEKQKEEALKNLEDSERTKEELESQLKGANDRANEILAKATEQAQRRRDKIAEEAKQEAEAIVRQAKTEAELEKKRAEDEIKTQIVEVSFALGEKIIEREIKTEDHHALIDNFISQIGDDKDEE